MVCLPQKKSRNLSKQITATAWLSGKRGRTMDRFEKKAGGYRGVKVAVAAAGDVIQFWARLAEFTHIANNELGTNTAGNVIDQNIFGTAYHRDP